MGSSDHIHRCFVYRVTLKSAERARAPFRHAANAYGDQINMALTGGYDSRLMLAQLSKLNRKPSLHVYGQSTDADVRIAKLIAADKGLQLKHTEKKKPTSKQDPQLVEAFEDNFVFFDGWPVDGIFDSGADKESRLSRARHNVLSLNGGAGGMYRNAYYVRNVSITMRDMLGIFYTQFDPSKCGAPFSLPAFYANLETKLTEAIRSQSRQLTRVQVELIYPLVRCRFWMGRNTTLNTRLGPTLTPFVDQQIIETASRISLKHKNYGRLEAAMIHALNPSLASYVSDYGHNFSTAPPLKRRLGDTLIHLRPVWLRRYAYRIKNRRLARLEGLHSPEGIEQVLGYELTVARQLMDLGRINDPEQFLRLATIDYLARRVNADPSIDFLTRC